ncbi:MAG TPA: hypothetical protein VGG72_07355 [Bryobacteraceae bacterium]|jgi:hypothetical protein
MQPTLKVKSSDATEAARREAAAERVLAAFGNGLPKTSLFCFFDDEDWKALKEEMGASNRGVYTDLRRGTAWQRVAPYYLKERLFIEGQRMFDCFIYLHGSTCSRAGSLTMTFAHELQHFVQQQTTPRMWAASTLVTSLPNDVINALGLRWFDVPHKREARIVSKRVAEKLLGPEVVAEYIKEKIAERVTENDVVDWECIQGLVTSAPYDLARETRLLFSRLRNYREQVERSLKGYGDDPAFSGIDLDRLLEGS